MRLTYGAICLFLMLFTFSFCTGGEQSVADEAATSEADTNLAEGEETTNNTMSKKTITEVTTFSITPDADPAAFNKRDGEVEADFTSKQPGFVSRQSGVDGDGNYVVIVYWESMDAAGASMQKFMGDASVADYAQMIDGPTMKMARYEMDQAFSATGSEFVEVMAFDLNEGVDLAEFDALNHKVETDFTGKREGFMQRLVGVNEAGRQAVAIYWASKVTSDASLQPFMEAPIAKEFMGKMDQPTVSMGRYEMLK